MKDSLNHFYHQYNFKERLNHDPIMYPHRYSDPEDIEIAGFIASCFAYGKADLFKPVIEKILNPGHKHPLEFFMNFSLQKDRKYFNGLKYRFNQEKDIVCFLYILSRILRQWKSLKNLFYHHHETAKVDIRESLAHVSSCFMGIDTSPVYGKNIKPHGLSHFFPSPKNGSACKRMNLFLRWMVRTRDIDLGIWDEIEPSKLIIPLDTHIMKVASCLGLTRRTSSDWKTAKEITESLKKLDSEDPLKYDFVLCHHGISGHCKGKKSRANCLTCFIYPI
jgi:uncharacterized protein (TIGR02757 family)